MKNSTLTPKFITKLTVSLILLIVFIGLCYMFISVYFTNKYVEETAQKLNANLANHLIKEKFQNASPFLEDGSVNKELFGDLMHDMMAVNQRIEVYLLDDAGKVLYSVVLNHDNPNEPSQYVDLNPVNAFIACNGTDYILGDDPRNPGVKKIFSAASFESQGKNGFIYIILDGKALEEVTSALSSSYILKMGLGASVLTMIFAFGIGILSIWFLTKNLRTIIQTVVRFREGDHDIRIKNPEQSDLSILAQSFNEMADTISENMEQIKSVDALRRELIANVSHDLRTPLAILKGYVETLQIKEGSLTTDERDHYLEIIQESSTKLSNLITQLFEYSKLEAKQVEPKKEPFSITDLSLDLIAKYEMLANKKNIAIQLQAENQVPLVFADISLVERALQNLIDNALKFTPEGGEVNLVVSSSEKSVEVSVSDTGPGIKESEQQYVFERYRQSNGSTQREGIGLGLAIVKKIMELHNTSIRVISQPDRGSTFLFVLPSYAN